MKTPLVKPPSQKWNVVGIIAAVIYIVSPIDLIPEVFFGPFGFADDLIALIIAVKKFLQLLNPPSKDTIMPSEQFHSNAYQQQPTESVAFCLHCGAQSPRFAKFCHACGKQLKHDFPIKINE